MNRVVSILGVGLFFWAASVSHAGEEDAESPQPCATSLEGPTGQKQLSEDELARLQALAISAVQAAQSNVIAARAAIAASFDLSADQLLSRLREQTARTPAMSVPLRLGDFNLQQDMVQLEIALQDRTPQTRTERYVGMVSDTAAEKVREHQNRGIRKKTPQQIVASMVSNLSTRKGQLIKDRENAVAQSTARVERMELIEEQLARYTAIAQTLRAQIPQLITDPRRRAILQREILLPIDDILSDLGWELELNHGEYEQLQTQIDLLSEASRRMSAELRKAVETIPLLFQMQTTTAHVEQADHDVRLVGSAIDHLMETTGARHRASVEAAVTARTDRQRSAGAAIQNFSASVRAASQAWDDYKAREVEIVAQNLQAQQLALEAARRRYEQRQQLLQMRSSVGLISGPPKDERGEIK